MITLIQLQATQNLYSPKLKQFCGFIEFENYEVDPLAGTPAHRDPPSFTWATP